MLNEKTLELNITAELLQIARFFDSKSFVFGTTLYQEGKNLGYDSSIIGEIPINWLIGAYQYKMATKMDYDIIGKKFVFKINDNGNHDQHSILWGLCGGQPNIAFYLLPCLITLYDIHRYAPHLLAQIALVDASQISPYFTGNQTHELHVYPEIQRALLLSQAKEVKLNTSTLLIELIQQNRWGVSPRRMIENIKNREYAAYYKSNKMLIRFITFPEVE